LGSGSLLRWDLAVAEETAERGGKGRDLLGQQFDGKSGSDSLLEWGLTDVEQQLDSKNSEVLSARENRAAILYRGGVLQLSSNRLNGKN